MAPAHRWEISWPSPRVGPDAFGARLSSGVGAVKLAFRIQSHAEPGRVAELETSVNGYRLVEQERVEHGHDSIGLGRHHEKLGVWAVVACDDEVIAVYRRSV